MEHVGVSRDSPTVSVMEPNTDVIILFMPLRAALPHVDNDRRVLISSIIIAGVLSPVLLCACISFSFSAPDIFFPSVFQQSHWWNHPQTCKIFSVGPNWATALTLQGPSPEGEAEQASTRHCKSLGGNISRSPERVRPRRAASDLHIHPSADLHRFARSD